jgi:hypothetical protein
MSVGEGFSLADPCCPFFSATPALKWRKGRTKGRYSNEMEVTVPGTEPRLGLLALISTGCCREREPALTSLPVGLVWVRVRLGALCLVSQA